MSTPAPGDPLPIVEQSPLPLAEVLATPKPTPSSAAGRIEFLHALKYVFSHPEWFKNLLIFAVFTFIPVLNTVLVFGCLT